MAYWGGGGGGCDPKKPKNSPKFKVCTLLQPSVFRYFFRLFSVIFDFLWYFFGLNFERKFKPFENNVKNEVLRVERSRIA